MICSAAIVVSAALAMLPQVDVDGLLRLANDSVAAYAPRVSGASMDERNILTYVSRGQGATPVRIASEVVFVNVNGRPYTECSNAKHTPVDLTRMSR